MMTQDARVTEAIAETEAIKIAKRLLDSDAVTVGEVLDDAELAVGAMTRNHGSSLTEAPEFNDYEKHDLQRNGSALFREALKRKVAAEREAQRVEDMHNHWVFRPEVVAEVAVQLDDEANWDEIAIWVDGEIITGQDPSGEYHSLIQIPDVGAAGEGDFIIKRHDGSFDIRQHVAAPSEDSLASLKVQALREFAEHIRTHAARTDNRFTEHVLEEDGVLDVINDYIEHVLRSATPGAEVYEDIAKAREAAVLRKHIAELERDAELDQIDPDREWPIVLLKERAAKLEENNPVAGMSASYWEG